MKGLRLGCIAALLVAAGISSPGASNGLFPKPISSDLPMYPELARNARITGTVKLWFVVNIEGELTDAQIISGHPILASAAISIVKSWKFQPNSIPRSVRHETEFVYVLNVQSEKGEPKLSVSMKDFRRVEVETESYVEPIE